MSLIIEQILALLFFPMINRNRLITVFIIFNYDTENSR